MSVKNLEICRGCTRTVLLAGRWAIKFPTFETWPLFLRGLLANMQEHSFARWDGHGGRLCPVVFAVPLGFCIVMPRCESLLDDLTEAEYEAAREGFEGMIEPKRNSFGLLNGRLVAVDYGS